jgi:hypothetical protein
MHVMRLPRPLRAVAPAANIPAAIESVVLRAMAKSQAARYQSARDLSQALERALKARDQLGEISGTETTAVAVTPPRRMAMSRWLPAGMIAASILGGMMLPGSRSPSAPKALLVTASVAARPAVATTTTTTTAPVSATAPALAPSRPAAPAARVPAKKIKARARKRSQ